GTYVTEVIVPVLKASLKNLPIGKSGFITTAEKESLASKNRKGKYGKKPDIMFMLKHKKKKYELMYGECSRLVCDEQKEEMDRTKLWREINDGMFWVHKGCLPTKEEFGIVGIQVAGARLYLNVLIRDKNEIHRLYELRSPTIPVKPSNSDTVFDFVETLLILRNILLVNSSLIFNAKKKNRSQSSENSSSVSTPP
ncbi:10755_t:CDS:2, partial [Racocetra persica]